MKAGRLSAWDKACLRVLILKHLTQKRDYLESVMIRCRYLTKRYTASGVKEACKEICESRPKSDRGERILFFVEMLSEESHLML